MSGRVRAVVNHDFVSAISDSVTEPGIQKGEGQYTQDPEGQYTQDLRVNSPRTLQIWSKKTLDPRRFGVYPKLVIG